MTAHPLGIWLVVSGMKYSQRQKMRLPAYLSSRGRGNRKHSKPFGHTKPASLGKALCSEECQRIKPSLGKVSAGHPQMTPGTFAWRHLRDQSETFQDALKFLAVKHFFCICMYSLDASALSVQKSPPRCPKRRRTMNCILLNLFDNKIIRYFPLTNQSAGNNVGESGG